MEEEVLRNKLYSYIFYVTSVVVLLSAMLFRDLYLVVVVAILMFVSAAYFKSGHVINNLLIKKSKLIEIYNGYVLSKNLTSAVKKVGSSNLGVSIALLNVTRELESRPEQFRQILESVKEPFEFSIGLVEVDRTRLIEGLETRRRMKEITLTRMSQKSYDKINKTRREMDLIEDEIKNVKGGSKSFNVILRIKTTSLAKEVSEAAREASDNLSKVANAFSTSFGLEYEILRGEKLLQALEVN